MGRPTCSRRSADERADNVVAQLPYVEVDTGGLVASDAAGELERQIVIGAGTVARAASARTPVATTWTGDETVTTETLPLLAGTGVDVAAGAARLAAPARRRSTRTGR